MYERIWQQWSGTPFHPLYRSEEPEQIPEIDSIQVDLPTTDDLPSLCSIRIFESLSEGTGRGGLVSSFFC